MYLIDEWCLIIFLEYCFHCRRNLFEVIFNEVTHINSCVTFEIGDSVILVHCASITADRPIATKVNTTSFKFI